MGGVKIEAPRGVGSGCPLPTGEGVWGEDYALSPEKFGIFCVKITRL